MNTRDALLLVDPETRDVAFEMVRDKGYKDIFGTMGASMALNDACKLVCAELRKSMPEERAPLTYDELVELDGKAVWAESPQGRFEPGWMIVCVEEGEVQTARCSLPLDSYGDYDDGWLAYTTEP